MKVTKLRSLVKAITWRLTGTVDTFVLTYLISRKLRIAGLVASWELFTKITLYYFHERAWNKITWGRMRDTEN